MLRVPLRVPPLPHNPFRLNLCLSTLRGCPLQAVERAGYKKPSPIQMAAIPLGLQFRDVIGIAGGWAAGGLGVVGEQLHAGQIPAAHTKRV